MFWILLECWQKVIFTNKFYADKDTIVKQVELVAFQ